MEELLTETNLLIAAAAIGFLLLLRKIANGPGNGSSGGSGDSDWGDGCDSDGGGD